jgi:heat shock protein beta
MRNALCFSPRCSVVLHLKEDAAELADPVRLSRLIKQYSQFISFPIRLYSSRKEPVKVEDSEATARKQEAEDKRAAEKGETPAKVEPVMKTDYTEVWDWRVENENKPIWTRSPKDVSGEQYNEFFKQTFSEFLDPLAHVHFNVEGTIEFAAILYLPGMAPFDQQSTMARSRSIKLYVKRVFISDEFDEDLMPRWVQL